MMISFFALFFLHLEWLDKIKKGKHMIINYQNKREFLEHKMNLDNVLNFKYDDYDVNEEEKE